MTEADWRPTAPPLTSGELPEALAASPAVVLLFWAQWDPTSRRQDAMLERLRPTLAPHLAVYSMDVDPEAHWEVCVRYNLVNVPTLLFFVRGEEGDRMVGRRAEDVLGDRLREWQALADSSGTTMA